MCNFTVRRTTPASGRFMVVTVESAPETGWRQNMEVRDARGNYYAMDSLREPIDPRWPKPRPFRTLEEAMAVANSLLEAMAVQDGGWEDMIVDHLVVVEVERSTFRPRLASYSLHTYKVVRVVAAAKQPCLAAARCI